MIQNVNAPAVKGSLAEENSIRTHWLNAARNIELILVIITFVAMVGGFIVDRSTGAPMRPAASLACAPGWIRCAISASTSTC